MIRYGFGVNKNELSHVVGNVSEMTLSKEAFGGNWQESLATVMENDQQQWDSPNYFTGFRNICKWERIEILN